MEEAVQFFCNGNRLYGILHIPERQGAAPDVVIIVSGGPQIRYGSHRLYVQLARHLCSRGVAVFRFDYEGMGDSEGASVEAEGAGPSIHAAVQYIDAVLPGGRKIIWSLCDGSTASAQYASRHEGMLAGLILCNPFVRDNVTAFRKHYYKERLFDKGFWTKLLNLQIDFRESLFEGVRFLSASVMHALKDAFGERPDEPEPFTPDSFLRSVQASPIPIHCILSSNDYVAREFHDVMLSHKAKKALENTTVEISFISSADHTFTRPEFKESLFALTAKALQGMGSVLDAGGYDETGS
jgi:uncharacterized protein